MTSPADKQAQKFVNDCKSRIRSIESDMGSDWETPEYIKGLAQVKFLTNCIDVVVNVQNESVRITEELGRNCKWGLDKETELLKEKLLVLSLTESVVRLRSEKAVLVGVVGKLNVKL